MQLMEEKEEIDSLELKELMKCSNTDLYKNINELIKEGKR